MKIYRRHTNYPTLLFVSLLSFSQLVHSALQEGIIDDESGDSSTGFKPIYDPPDEWQQGNTCGECLHATPADTTEKTWHDTSVIEPRSIELHFTGVSITIYCIIPTGQFGLTPNMDWTYTLDNGPDTSHTTPQPNENPIDDFIYNVSVLSLQDLTSTSHTLILKANPPSSGQSVILFDSAKYTFDDSSSSVSITPAGSTTDSSTSTTSSSTPLSNSQTSSDSAPTDSTSSGLPTSSSTYSSPSPISSNLNTNNSSNSNNDDNNNSDRKFAVILGPILGVLALLALVLSLRFIYIHRRRRKAFSRRPEFRVDPFFSPPSRSQATAPLPPLPVAPLIPYTQNIQNAVGGMSSSPPSGMTPSENGHSAGSAAAVTLTSRVREKAEIGQLRTAIADLHRMVREVRGVYHGGGGNNNMGSSDPESSSSLRDRKVRVAAGG
ncbi:hypothetical protein K435DRAFT_836372 [Dendrothele bispora CBS 962.96]|uniref:Mid2 domain-containing protein n=1 Tax=Dendrothele bispora (strain CBS 962.96) TaxID=1314807 RepID=A0A4S8MIF0_DENBC|nr:hypothetical protein K435DRAFT_836372 [Dendrothele bispora CBS 962.96]